MTGHPVAEGGSEPVSPGIRTGWRIGIGVAAIVASGFTFVLLPVVVTVIAGWWLAADMRSAGARAPSWFGKVALAMLAVLWLAISWLVVGFDAHFDCGGTLGGFGESASARLDDGCYEQRVVRVPIAMVAVVAGAVGAAVWLRRRARRHHSDGMGRPRSVEAIAAAVVGLCTLMWTLVIVALVVT